jgi:hypothetical protein
MSLAAPARTIARGLRSIMRFQTRRRHGDVARRRRNLPAAQRGAVQTGYGRYAGDVEVLMKEHRSR